MPIAITLPTLDSNPAKTILPQRAWITVLPSGGSALVFKITTGSFSKSVEKKERDTAQADGTILTDRSIVTKVKRGFKFTLDEFSADVATLMNATQITGTARVWARDPDDAVGVASYMTNEFSCTIVQDGDFTLDPADWAKVSFAVDILGTFTNTFDAATV